MALFTTLSRLPPGEERHRLRCRLVELHLPLAKQLARRFRDRGEPPEDLRQVASLGLLKAVDGFDPAKGVPFSGYAIPTITGELKRHFRDRCWDVRVPRRLQETRLRVNTATDRLTQALGRSPTIADIAAHTGLSEEDVIETLEANQAYRSRSLDAPAGGPDGDDATLGDRLGDPDDALLLVEEREALRPLLARLPAREQRIIALRFYGNLTQSQIATATGISQMHVSRLLTRALRELRAGLSE